MRMDELKGSAPYNFHKSYSSENQTFYIFEAGFEEYEVAFQRITGGLFSLNFCMLEFSEDDEEAVARFDITGAGNASRIFATLVAIIKDFLGRSTNVNVIRFVADNNEPSRVRLYQRLAQWYKTFKVDTTDYRINTPEVGVYEIEKISNQDNSRDVSQNPRTLEENHITHTEYQLEQKFAHYNKLLFANKIPDLPLFFGPLKRAGGVTTYRTNTTSLGRVEYIPGTLSITLSNSFRREESGFDGILIHEMIHALLASNGHPKHDHGPLFTGIAKKCESIVGFKVPLTDAVLDLELTDKSVKKVDGALRSVNGKWYIGFFAANTLSDERVADLNTWYGGPYRLSPDDEIILFRGETDLLPKYPAKRWTDYYKVLNRVYAVRDVDRENLLKDAKILAVIKRGSHSA